VFDNADMLYVPEDPGHTDDVPVIAPAAPGTVLIVIGKVEAVPFPQSFTP
jgi:hypothetical protein